MHSHNHIGKQNETEWLHNKKEREMPLSTVKHWSNIETILSLHCTDGDNTAVYLTEKKTTELVEMNKNEK